VLRHFKGARCWRMRWDWARPLKLHVLKEYWMRGLVRRALILAPPSLVSQWKGDSV